MSKLGTFFMSHPVQQGGGEMAIDVIDVAELHGEFLHEVVHG